MQPKAPGPQEGDGGLGQEAGCRELRHRARDGVLGVGDSEDGRSVAAPAKKGPTPGPAAFEAVGRPLGLFFMGRGTPRRPSTDSVTTEAPSRSNEMRSRRGHARILECRTCVEQTRPQSGTPRVKIGRPGACGSSAGAGPVLPLDNVQLILKMARADATGHLQSI